MLYTRKFWKRSISVAWDFLIRQISEWELRLGVALRADVVRLRPDLLGRLPLFQPSPSSGMGPNRPLPVAAEEVIHFSDPTKLMRDKLLKQKAARKSAATSSDPLGDAKELKRPKPLRKTDYHDMLRYGIAELKGEERSQARMRLAVQLGAKPPKKTIKNYKGFLEQLKKDKEEKQTIADERQILQTAIKLAKPKGKNDRKFRGKKRSGKGPGGRLDGQIGVYRHGVQFISKRDIAGGEKPRKSKK